LPTPWVPRMWGQRIPASFSAMQTSQGRGSCHPKCSGTWDLERPIPLGAHEGFLRKFLWGWSCETTVQRQWKGLKCLHQTAMQHPGEGRDGKRWAPIHFNPGMPHLRLCSLRCAGRFCNCLSMYIYVEHPASLKGAGACYFDWLQASDCFVMAAVTH
jgi:hypothetical protein